jgi:uncharacterized protein (DUF2147 family)
MLTAIQFFIKCSFYFVFSLFTMSAFSQSLVGVWEQTNKDGHKGALVRIEKSVEGNKYVGTIMYVYHYPQDVVCTNCKGNYLNKPVVGMQFMYDMEYKKGELVNGKIIDIKTGKTYYSKVSYNKQDDALVLRASIDASGFIGETQVWKRHRKHVSYLFEPNSF